jgi:DNA-binding transcriptional MerR regulator
VPDLMTTAEVAELFRTSPETVRYWRFTGTGPPGVKIGTKVLYDRAEALAWWQAKRAAEREGARSA